MLQENNVATPDNDTRAKMKFKNEKKSRGEEIASGGCPDICSEEPDLRLDLRNLEDFVNLNSLPKILQIPALPKIYKISKILQISREDLRTNRL